MWCFLWFCLLPKFNLFTRTHGGHWHAKLTKNLRNQTFRAWRSCCWAVEKQLSSWWGQFLPPNFKKRQPSNPSNLFFPSIVQLGVSKIDLQGSQKSEFFFAACKVWPSSCSGHWPEITLPTKSKELREKTGACLDSYCSIVRWLCIVRFCLLKLKWEIPVVFFRPQSML